MVTARAWCRVDLAGGTLDIWPLGLLHEPACTVNVAVSLEVTARLVRRLRGWKVVQEGATLEAPSAEGLLEHPQTALVGLVARALELPPCEVSLHSASPRGGGLGASSALAVALIAAAEALLDRPPSSPLARARLARDLEARLMSLPTGVQDHFPALLGGALEILYEPGEPRVRRLQVDLEELDRHLLVVYSGQSHFSAGKNWQVVRRRLDGDPAVVGLFDGIARVARAVPAAVERGDFEGLGGLVGEEWALRRQLAQGVTTPVVEDLVQRALSSGAWGAKACGAGGGGCLVIVCPPQRKDEISRVLADAGAELLPARAARGPLEVTRDR